MNIQAAGSRGEQQSHLVLRVLHKRELEDMLGNQTQASPSSSPSRVWRCGPGTGMLTGTPAGEDLLFEKPCPEVSPSAI